MLNMLNIGGWRYICILSYICWYTPPSIYYIWIFTYNMQIYQRDEKWKYHDMHIYRTPPIFSIFAYICKYASTYIYKHILHMYWYAKICRNMFIEHIWDWIQENRENVDTDHTNAKNSTQTVIACWYLDWVFRFLT